MWVGFADRGALASDGWQALKDGQGQPTTADPIQWLLSSSLGSKLWERAAARVGSRLPRRKLPVHPDRSATPCAGCYPGAHSSSGFILGESEPAFKHVEVVTNARVNQEAAPDRFWQPMLGPVTSSGSAPFFTPSACMHGSFWHSQPLLCPLVSKRAPSLPVCSQAREHRAHMVSALFSLPRPAMPCVASFMACQCRAPSPVAPVSTDEIRYNESDRASAAALSPQQMVSRLSRIRAPSNLIQRLTQVWGVGFAGLVWRV